jgi:hypothetical protein
MKLYEFLEKKYDECNFKDEIDFDEFIEGFMSGTFCTRSVHEAFWGEDDFLGTFNIGYEIDHENRRIELLFE